MTQFESGHREARAVGAALSVRRAAGAASRAWGWGPTRN
jgi:hypothetical protein